MSCVYHPKPAVYVAAGIGLLFWAALAYLVHWAVSR
jgi:hypothetical protein